MSNQYDRRRRNEILRDIRDGESQKYGPMTIGDIIVLLAVMACSVVIVSLAALGAWHLVGVY